MQFDREKIVRCLRLSLISGVITVMVALFVVSNWMGYLWHAYNGNTIEVSEWRIPVPPEYWSAFGAKHSFWRVSFGMPLFHTGRGYIGVHSSQPQKEQVTKERIEWAVLKAATDGGLHLQERRTIRSSAGETYCFQFSVPAKVHEVEVRCVNEMGVLGIFYRGSPRYSNDIYGVVAGIQPR